MIRHGRLPPGCDHPSSSASGLVLMTFVATHLLNHALGIHSLATMEGGRTLFLGV